MKYLIIPLIFFFQFSYAVEEEITNWFNQESEKFLEIMNNSDGQNNEKYDEYVKFVEKNFAVKSIAFGLIPESVLSKSNKSDLKNYEYSFQNYLTKTIYNLSNFKDFKLLKPVNFIFQFGNEFRLTGSKSTLFGFFPE